MFEWIRRLLRASADDGRQAFFEKVDALNADIGGGRPIVTQQFLGCLKLPSGTLILGDPFVPSFEVPNIQSPDVGISAKLRRYLSGLETITSLTLRFGEAPSTAIARTIGEVGIDSAKLVVADKADFEEHWTEVGKDRIGVISTAPDDKVLRMLTKRFQLKTVRANPIHAEIVGPVSIALEKQIEDFLKSIPEYAAFPYMHFRVESNNSFERANHLEKPWDFIPLGNQDEPLMFVCGTGRGDGAYDVKCVFHDDVPRVVSIDFIDDGGV